MVSFSRKSPKKFNHLDQRRIRSEQGRMKFYVFFVFLHFFTFFNQFSTFLIIFSHFKTFFHIFSLFFHFIFCFKKVAILGENTSNTTWSIKLWFLGRSYPNNWTHLTMMSSTTCRTNLRRQKLLSGSCLTYVTEREIKASGRRWWCWTPSSCSSATAVTADDSCCKGMPAAHLLTCRCHLPPPETEVGGTSAEASSHNTSGAS